MLYTANFFYIYSVVNPPRFILVNRIELLLPTEKKDSDAYKFHTEKNPKKIKKLIFSNLIDLSKSPKMFVCLFVYSHLLLLFKWLKKTNKNKQNKKKKKWNWNKRTKKKPQKKQFKFLWFSFFIVVNIRFVYTNHCW